MNMRKAIIAISVILLSTASLAAWSHGEYYSARELDKLISPIALYPDPLLAQVLPASTYPDQLYDASRFTSHGKNRSRIGDQDWDVSVKAVSHYPAVLNYMVKHPDWTIAIGQAYVNQPSDVFSSIQRLRHKARSYGFLSTNRYQTVNVQSGRIRVVPMQSTYIFVPQYNPQVVFVTRRTSINSISISFGVGLLIGVWLDRDCDWQSNRVYYHGWSGPGWISHSKPFVRVGDNHYVNTKFALGPISIGRSVTNRDIKVYRKSVIRNTGSFILPKNTSRLTPNYGRPHAVQPKLAPARRTSGKKGPSVGRTQKQKPSGQFGNRNTPRRSTPAVKKSGRGQKSPTPANIGKTVGRGQSRSNQQGGQGGGNSHDVGKNQHKGGQGKH